MDKEDLWDIYSQLTKREALIFTNTSEGSSIKHLAVNGQVKIIDKHLAVNGQVKIIEEI